MVYKNNRVTDDSGDTVGSIPFWGRDGDKTVLIAEIRVVVDTPTSAGKVPARFEFYTADSNGALQKAFTIDSAQLVTPVSGLSSSSTLTAAAALKLSGIETGLTAHAGGGQAVALALSGTKSVHNIATVSSASDSVSLPAATGSGAFHFVKNSGAAQLQLYGSGTDTIDGVATGTGVALANGKTRICVDVAAGAWQSILGA